MSFLCMCRMGTCQGSGLCGSRGPDHPPVTLTGWRTRGTPECPALQARWRPPHLPVFLRIPGSCPPLHPWALAPWPSSLPGPPGCGLQHPLPHSGCSWPRCRDFAPVSKSSVVGAASLSAAHPACCVLRGWNRAGTQSMSAQWSWVLEENNLPAHGLFYHSCLLLLHVKEYYAIVSHSFSAQNILNLCRS